MPFYDSFFKIQCQKIQDIWIIPRTYQNTFGFTDIKNELTFHSIYGRMAMPVGRNPCKSETAAIVERISTIPPSELISI
jgi:hypothetical protein